MDTVLLQRIVERDGSALGELYDRKAALLYRLITRIIRDPAEAEDVLQEVFLRIWQQADTYDPVFGEPTSWLVRIARNRAIDRVRARGSRPLPSEANVADVVIAGDGAHPHVTAVGVETREAVKGALLEIDPEQRVLIHYAFFLGYTQSELADKFSLPLGTVKTRIRRGMMAMRKKLHQVPAMNQTDLYELAALDAAGALDAEARRDYERRLAQATAEDKAAIAQLYDGATAVFMESLAEGESPAPGVRDKVISAMVTARRFVSVRAGEGEWKDLGVQGVLVRTLHVDTERHTATLHVRVTGGVVYPGHHHAGPEDTYVSSGEVIIQGQRLRQGDFHHAEADSDHDPIICERECELLLIVDATDYLGA